MYVEADLDVDSAKPSDSDREEVPHHLLDILTLDEDYSVDCTHHRLLPHLYLLPFRNLSFPTHHHNHRSSHAVRCGLREIHERISSVKNTQKITEAMKLVAAAKPLARVLNIVKSRIGKFTCE
ncbi:hypothetical protein QJS04_geneDACA016316 [Acorus gramineus]|uniref:Uncharacterized protein n=1 Tax=Acorus gramineus TaxID=55184 RepID=A0AAV9AR67_ACOGR|nr:hypothetical protein QJS04_geneDACA016316 [Acorus gramineus]